MTAGNVGVMNQISSLQVMRAIAAIGVVSLHVGGSALFVGNAGVDLFFVISGFVMVYSSANLFGKAASIATFAIRRILRIAPLYWLVTATLVLLYGGETGAAILKTLFFVPYANATGAWLPIGYVGWTLNYEMFFYVIFAVALVLPRRFAVAVVVGAIAFLALIGHFAAPSGIVDFWTKPIILEFAFGCVLGLAYLEGLRLPRPLTAVLVMAAIVALVLGTSSSEMVRPFVWGLSAAALVAAACLVKKPWLLGDLAAPLRLLGDASYALYLVHVPVLSFMVGQGYPRPVIFWSTIVVAIVVHWVVEKPIASIARAWRQSSARARQDAAAHDVPAATQGARP